VANSCCYKVAVGDDFDCVSPKKIGKYFNWQNLLIGKIAKYFDCVLPKKLPNILIGKIF
jgi:hypothetical protein